MANEEEVPDLTTINEIMNQGKNEGRISDKVVKIITLDSESKRLGNINKQELKTLFNLSVRNKLYFNNTDVINDLIDEYLHLSVSQNATLLRKIENMFKSAEITAKMPNEVKQE